jgi:hypothetical protein
VVCVLEGVLMVNSDNGMVVVCVLEGVLMVNSDNGE